MEGDGLIISEWDIQESGPARRIYRILKRFGLFKNLDGKTTALKTIDKNSPR